jgi:hypothetical protein
VEVYIPDLPAPPYKNLLLSFEEEFTYTFGGCTIISDLSGSYLAQSGARISDRINLIYADVPLPLSTNFDKTERYVDELKQAAYDALVEETVLVVVAEIYHAL